MNRPSRPRPRDDDEGRAAAAPVGGAPMNRPGPAPGIARAAPAALSTTPWPLVAAIDDPGPAVGPARHASTERLAASRERRSRMRRRDLGTLGLAAASFSAPFCGGAARAQGGLAIPTRPPTLVIPFPPGGIVDTVGRMTAERVGPQLGQTIVIENRPGAGSAVANAHVAASRPDGTTILAGGIGLAIIPNLQPQLEPRDPRKALAPVGGSTSTPYILHVNRGLPVSTLDEFVAWAKRRGAELNAATSGIGTGVHLVWELFRRRAGITEGEIIHFRGGVPAITDIAAGRADFMWGTALEAIQAMRAGQTKPIAVTSLRRLAALPDLPTVAESGYPDFEVTSWAGWYVAAGTPAPIVARLSAALEAGLADRELAARLEALGVQVRFQPPAALAALLEAEILRWGRLIAEAGVRMES
jgi:tripartite-type tricarboxylate transporter receptor subunit TctC